MEKAETRAAGVGKHSVIETGLGKRGREGVESSSRVRSRPLSGQQAAAKRKLVSRERNGALGDSQKISVFRPAVLFSPAGLPSEKDVARNKVEEDKKNICEDEEVSSQMQQEKQGHDRTEWKVAADAEKPVRKGCEAEADRESRDGHARTGVHGTPLRTDASMPSPDSTCVASYRAERDGRSDFVDSRGKQSVFTSFQERELEEAHSERATRCCSRSNSIDRTERERTEGEERSMGDEKRKQKAASGMDVLHEEGGIERKSQHLASHSPGSASCKPWTTEFEEEKETVESELEDLRRDNQPDGGGETAQGGSRQNGQRGAIYPFRRYNPRRACRDRRGMTPCGLEWTKHLIEMAKDQAFDITWSMKDSPSLRRLLVVRPEEKPEVGMGLFLVQPLLSCSCTIWEETKRRYSQQRPRTVASEKPRTSSGNQAGGSKRKETGGEENENGGDNCVDTRTELWTARSEEGCTDRSSEGSAGEGRKENMMEDRNLTTSTKSQIPPTLLTPNLATQIRARAGRTGFYQRIKTEGEPAQHRYKYRNSALQKQGKGGDGWRSPKQEPKQGANRVENETAPPAGSTAAKDKEGRPRYRCSADARMGHSRDITAEEREANEEQCTHAYQVKKRARTETQDQGFDRGHRPQESPVSDSSCPSCPRSENSPDYVNGTAPHKQRNGEVSAASPRDGELTVPTASAPTDSSGCWLDQSSSSRDTFSRCARSAEEKKHSETTDAKHIPVLACGCGGGNGGFRMLCFRGDVVLSAFNDCRLKNLSTISAAETDLIYCPDENPGIEPASHLSPAFTLESLNIPFSFQLQAHPYLSTGLSDDVKAVFGNHYCARHCHGFFDIHQSSAPCIVTRPGGEIPSGPFGVFYGWRGTRSYPCGYQGCNHVCSPRCKCYDEEAAWRAAWRRHQRQPVPE